MDRERHGSPPPYEQPEVILEADLEHIARADRVGNITTHGGTQYINNYSNVGGTPTQHINGTGVQAHEVERLRQELQESQAREQALRAEADAARAPLEGLRRNLREEVLARALDRSQRRGASKQERHYTNFQQEHIGSHSSADKRIETQMYDDPMDIDQDCTPILDIPRNRTIEVGGHVWNAARYEMVFGLKGLAGSMQENIVDKESVQKRSTEKTRLARTKQAEYSFTLSRQCFYNAPNIRIFTSSGTSLKPIRKFYLKVFAVDDQGVKGLSKFRQFGTQRRGRCFAELDKQGQSISFSHVGKGRTLCSWWFPGINPRAIRQVFHDPRSSSLKIQWSTGRTLYAQFRPSHYKLFCQLLRFSCGANVRSSGRDKDLSSWTASLMRKIYS